MQTTGEKNTEFPDVESLSPVSESSKSSTKEKSKNKPIKHKCLKINEKVLQRRSKEAERSLESCGILLECLRSLEYVFEAAPGEKVQQFITLENVSSAKVKYSWGRMSLLERVLYQSDPHHFNQLIMMKEFKKLIPEKLLPPMFFFNKSTGVLGPNKSTKIPILFCSKVGGLFKERWQLKTNPPLVGSNSFGEIEITLLGLVTNVAKMGVTHPIEIEFQSQRNYSFAQSIIVGIIEKIIRPNKYSGDGPIGPSLVLADPNIETDLRNLFQEINVFYWVNPTQYHYHPSVISNLKCLYRDITGKNGREKHWNLSIEQLREMVVGSNNHEAKSKYLDIFCTNVDVLLEPVAKGVKDEKKYLLVYNILCNMVEKIHDAAETFWQTFGFCRPNVFRGQPYSLLPIKSEQGSKTSQSLPHIIPLSSNEWEVSESLQRYYQEALYIKVYYQLQQTVDSISICLESTKNKYLVDDTLESSHLYYRF